MEWPVELMGSQMAQDWDEVMRGFATVLTWTAWLGILAFVLGSVLAASRRASRPRRFWCPWAAREVEVLVDEWGPPGFRQVLGVRACSVFEPASAIACRRACRDSTCRKPADSVGPFGMKLA